MRTLQRGLRAYQDARLAGLALRWRPGRRARIPAALAPEILGWLLQGLPGCGLDRATWTYARLATQLDRIRGITVSASTMRACCTGYGVRPYRPTYRNLRGDAAPQVVARQDLQALNKRPRPESLSCWAKMKRACR